MQSFQLEIHPTPEDLVARGTILWRQWSAAAIAERGRFTVALAGGSTPKQLYRALAQTPGLDWQHTWLFWGDERYVPPDHPDSNYRMVQEALLDAIAIPPAQVIAPPTDGGDPAQDAQRYQATLQQLFTSDWPQFDLTLLGMGGDGHTASLFPGTPALGVEDRWVTVGEKEGQPRITLTRPALNASRQVVLLITGAGKAARLQEVLTTPPHLPIQQIRPQGHLLWFLDVAAAAQLPLQIELGT